MILPVGSFLLVLGLVTAAYVRFVLTRNKQLVRPPVLGADGAPLPERTFTYSDGQTVDCLVVGPTAGAGPTARPRFCWYREPTG